MVVKQYKKTLGMHQQLLHSMYTAMYQSEWKKKVQKECKILFQILLPKVDFFGKKIVKNINK